MNDRLKEHLKRTCWKKTTWRSEQSAQKFCWSIKEITGDRLRPYRCSYCHKFHVTSSDLPDAKEMERGIRRYSIEYEKYIPDEEV